MLDGFREVLASLERRLDSFELRVDRRFETVDQRFLAIDQKFDSLDAKVSRQFLWLCGLHVTTLVAIVVSLSAR